MTGITTLAAVFNIATVSTTVAIMLGLSTGIDYGLFILSRHRSQLLAGRSLEGVVTAKPSAFQNDTAVIQVIPSTGPNDPATSSLVNQIRGEREQLAGQPGVTLLVGGTTASNIDVSAKLSGALPVFLIVVSALAFILLTFAFRTILVPIKSILGFLLSVVAALGAEVAVFQWGWGDVVSPSAIYSTAVMLASRHWPQGTGRSAWQCAHSMASSDR